MAAVQRPMLVLVGGPGGAGKTTLARALADDLGLVHICRDSVKSAIAFSDATTSFGVPQFDEAKAGMGGEYGQRAFATAYAAVAALLDGGASVVMDQAWRSGRSEGELLPLLERGRAVLVLATVASDIAAARVQSRGDRAGLAPLNQALAEATSDRASFLSFDLGVPRMTVNTANGYHPSLRNIESWICAHV